MKNVSQGPTGANRRRCVRRAAPIRFLDTPLARVIRAREVLQQILAIPPSQDRYVLELTAWEACRAEIACARADDGGAVYRDVATGRPVEECELAAVAGRLRALLPAPDLRALVVDLGAYRRWKLLAG